MSIAAGSGCSDSLGSICGGEAALMLGGQAGGLLATLLQRTRTEKKGQIVSTRSTTTAAPVSARAALLTL